MVEWSQIETGRYQDHVIVHVLGATALGYFILDDAAHLLLDIGLIWTIYTSGEMALMTQAAVIDDLEIEPEAKEELMADVGRLHQGKTGELARMSLAPEGFLIRDVRVYARGESRRVILEGEDVTLAVEGMTDTGHIRLFQLEGERDEA